MEIAEIQELLNQSDFHQRLKGIVALKDYEPAVAVPLLISKQRDPEFLVRSFVARSLGQNHHADSFSALLEMIKCDRDTNVQAEASNSLAMYGEVAVSHLVLAFYQNNNWLVRRSILAALLDLNSPNELLELCLEALKDEDMTVAQAGVDTLSTLAQTAQHQTALTTLLSLTTAENWRTRMHVAYALKRFDDPQATVALQQLQQDEHHRVVAAALENLI